MAETIENNIKVSGPTRSLNFQTKARMMLNTFPFSSVRIGKAEVVSQAVH